MGTTATAPELLEEARAAGVTLYPGDGGDLRYRCPPGGLDASLRDRLANRLPELADLVATPAGRLLARLFAFGHTVQVVGRAAPRLRVSPPPAPELAEAVRAHRADLLCLLPPGQETALDRADLADTPAGGDESPVALLLRAIEARGHRVVPSAVWLQESPVEFFAPPLPPDLHAAVVEMADDVVRAVRAARSYMDDALDED